MSAGLIERTLQELEKQENKKQLEKQKRKEIKKYIMLLDFFVDAFSRHCVSGKDLGIYSEIYDEIAVAMGKRFKLFDDVNKVPLIILTHGYKTIDSAENAHKRQLWLAKHLFKKVSGEEKAFEFTYLDRKIYKALKDFFELSDVQIDSLLIEKDKENENS
jgi:hypothetical protein